MRTNPLIAGEGITIPASRTWVEKVAEAMTAKTAVTLDADEVQSLGKAYAALEQRQAADVALSETHVYVLSPCRDGRAGETTGLGA